MIPALSLDEIIDECHYKENEKVVCIMIALYTDDKVKSLISQQYDFWNYYAGKGLDMYWLGYGAYYFPNLPGQHLVEGVKSMPSVYFDTSIFTKEIKKINDYIKFKYRGQIGVLVCNYRDDTIHLEESAFINISPLINKKDQRLESFATYLLDMCKNNSDIYDFVGDLQMLKHLYKIRDIKITEVLAALLGLL